MEFIDVIHQRRSVRRFLDKEFPDEYFQQALEHAILAPNSSNIQNWDFHWVKNPEKKQKLREACLNQSAARTASQLLVVTATVKKWKRSQKYLIEWVKNSPKAPKDVMLYYTKLIPTNYTAGYFNFFAPLKWLILNTVGLFRPMVRTPITSRDLQEVSIKSAALACENFVLSITNNGGATCMMEGFDESRVKRLLRLERSERIVMVIAVGYASESPNWGDRYRIPNHEVIHIH